MNVSTRWLIGIGVALALLVIITAAVAVATRNRPSTSYPENTPEGVTQRYINAISARDYQAAYGYLGPDLQESCTLEAWRQQSNYGPEQLQNASASLRDVDYPSADQANVEVTFAQVNLDRPFLFGPDEYRWDTTFVLKRLNGDIWRFSDFPWPAQYCNDRSVKPVPQVQ